MTRQSSENPDSHAVILNGDGVYIATYSALLLNLKLVRCAYYSSEEKSLPISEVCHKMDFRFYLRSLFGYLIILLKLKGG